MQGRSVGSSRRSARSCAKVPSRGRPIEEWKAVVAEFLELITRPVLHALSPEYQRGGRLDQIIEQTVDALQEELDEDGDPLAALMRLSEDDAVRILNIHKCKGLEFEKVVILGVEEDIFGETELTISGPSSLLQSRARSKSLFSPGHRIVLAQLRPSVVGMLFDTPNRNS